MDADRREAAGQEQCSEGKKWASVTGPEKKVSNSNQRKKAAPGPGTEVPVEGRRTGWDALRTSKPNAQRSTRGGSPERGVRPRVEVRARAQEYLVRRRSLPPI